jgi:hypothetical protein
MAQQGAFGASFCVTVRTIFCCVDEADQVAAWEVSSSRSTELQQTSGFKYNLAFLFFCSDP